MKNSQRIPIAIIPSVKRFDLEPHQVDREFGKLLSSGARLRVAGLARQNPERLFAAGLRPKHKFCIFDTILYLTNVRQIPELRFYVGYVVQPTAGRRTKDSIPANLLQRPVPRLAFRVALYPFQRRNLDWERGRSRRNSRWS